MNFATDIVPAAAQTRQYTPPGGPANERSERKEALAEAVAEARWNAGPLRLDPAFWISDLSWVDNPEAGVDSDLTARAGAGLRAYLPVGNRTTFAAFALPEYIWWRDRDGENRVNQRFGVGSFTYFNRLEIELTARRNEDFDYATGELFQKVTGRTDELNASLEIPVLRALSIHGAGYQSSFEALAEEEDFDTPFVDLNRDEVGYRGGIRYYPTEKVRLGTGIGHAETEFAEGATDRSNSGEYWYLEASYDRPKLGIALEYQQNELQGSTGSAFGSFEGDTFEAGLVWRPRESLALRAYASNALAYSLFTANQTAYVDESSGVGATVGLGWRLELDIYAESGSHDYESELGGDGSSADVDGFGVGLNVKLGRRFDLRIGYRKSDISAAGGRPQQTIEEIRGSLDFGIGGGSATWF